jgi:hypothetical protein
MTDARSRSPLQATLLDVLIDGFEKNEVLGGFHVRWLPLPDADAAGRKFAEFVEEGRRWKGAPTRVSDAPPRRIASWADLEICQVERAILVRVRAPLFDAWWHDRNVWEGDPFDAMFRWLAARDST